MIKVPKKVEYARFKNYARIIKSPFMIYVNFKSILVPEENRNQNPYESSTNKHQKHVSSCYGYKLVCVDHKFSKPFKSYLGEDVVYNFINSLVEKNKYCTDIVEKAF